MKFVSDIYGDKGMMLALKKVDGATIYKEPSTSRFWIWVTDKYFIIIDGYDLREQEIEKVVELYLTQYPPTYKEYPPHQK